MHRRASDPSMTPRELRARLEKITSAARVLDQPAERIAHAHDASFYRLIPQAVVFPQTEAEVIALLELSSEVTLPLTFRAAGTSLSGQSITDGLLDAFYEDRDVSTKDILRVAQGTSPLSTTMKEEIERIRNWVIKDKRAKPAATPRKLDARPAMSREL